MATFRIYNGPMQTTAKPAAVATGTSIKTLLQLKASATKVMRIMEWGISFDGSAAATPGSVELIQTDVAATVTAHVTADISRIDSDALIGGDPVTNLIQVGTSATGYTASAEGSTTAVRNLDAPQLIAPTTQFIKQFPLGQWPVIEVGKFGRIRVHFATTVNALCYVLVDV